LDKVLINSWWFDFDKMQAHRDPDWLLYHKGSDRNIVDISWDHKKNLMWKKVMEHVWQGHFFEDPESHHNETILRAYADYIFEKDVLSGT
jgi:hypothetical protein